MNIELSVVETSRFTGFRLDYIYRLIHSGRLHAKRVDGKWAISRKSVEDYATGCQERRRKLVHSDSTGHRAAV